MLKFCFPERDPDAIDYNDRNDDLDTESKGKKAKSGKRNRDSNFYVHIDDVEKMKARNFFFLFLLFLY